MKTTRFIITLDRVIPHGISVGEIEAILQPKIYDIFRNIVTLSQKDIKVRQEDYPEFEESDFGYE